MKIFERFMNKATLYAVLSALVVLSGALVLLTLTPLFAPWIAEHGIPAWVKTLFGILGALFLVIEIYVLLRKK